MWIPKDEVEIISVVNNGSLQETISFDAKARVSSNSTEIAKDIAAMTNDGGVIIYGIGEDDNKRLTILSPVELAGQPERITSVARTAISEPPVIHVHIISTNIDPTKGFIIVEVPPSPRAPHMVSVGGRNRYYGRTSTGNSPLTEGEVARLYARRQQTEVSRDAILQQELDRYPYAPNPALAYLYAFVHPVYLQTDDLLERTRRDGTSIQDTLWRLTRISKRSFTRQEYSPRLDDPYQWIPTVDGYRGDIDLGNDDVRHLIRLEIDHDGKGHLFCGRAADSLVMNDHTRLVFLPDLVAGNVSQFLFLFGNLYDQANYNGLVDLGVAVTGLKGSLPYVPRTWFIMPPAYEQDEYRRTVRCSAHELMNDTQAIASKLVMPLIRATTRADITPFLSN